LYHASAADGELAHYALYHGPTVVLERSPNLVRMLMERYQSFDAQIQGRIAWGMKTYGDKESTRKLLLALLDDHEKLDDATVGAALDVYQAVFDEAPPDLERFKNVGKWVVAYHHSDLSASHPRAAKILHDELDKPYFRNGGLQLVDFVTRVDDGHEVAVVLVQGVASRDTLTTYLSDRLYAKADFVEMLSPRTLQMRRLREFGKHLPEGTPKSARPEYTRPPADASYAYSASGFVAPDFAAFFADDAESGAQLDAAYADRENIALTDRELLELFRRGARRSAHKPNMMFGWISSALGWPGDPLLTEILYQGMDPQAPPEFRNAAIYYGFGLGTSKTKNVLEALFQAYMAPPFDRTTNGNTRSRILWGVRNHEDDKYYLATRFAAALQDHAALSDEALVQADAAYRQLTDTEPPNAADYASRGVFIVLFEGPRNQSAEDAKQQIAKRLGDSEHLLAIKVIDAEGHRTVVVVVRGAAGKHWLIEKLQTEPQVPIQFVDLLTREFIDAAKVEGKDVLRDLEQYLPAAR
jgi:hypothetical protein